MAQKDQRTSAKSPLPHVDPAEFAEMGKKQVETMMEAQKEFVGALEDMNRELAARVKTETDVAAEFSQKLMAARSIPEAAAVYQEWMGRRMAMFSEDSQRFAAELQKFSAMATRLLPTGWPGPKG